MSDDEQQVDEFEGFLGLLPDASEPEQIFNESIEESVSIHEELEGIAEALKSLSHPTLRILIWSLKILQILTLQL